MLFNAIYQSSQQLIKAVSGVHMVLQAQCTFVLH